MATTLELTLISATLSSDVQLEPKDIYATVKFGNEQLRTKTAYDHGRSPVWNETLTFNLDNQDFPKFIFAQLFAVRSDADELLGVARIPVPTSGEIEGSLHVLVSPSKGETGTLKAAGRWKSISQQSESYPSFVFDDMAKNRKNDMYAAYPHAASTYDDVTSAFSHLAVDKGPGKELYPSPVAYPPVAYPPQYKVEERSTHSSSPYPPPFDVSKDSYPPAPYPPKPDAYPPHPDYENSSSSSDRLHISKEREGKESANTTMRGLGDSADKGHHSHMPYGYPPPAMYGGGYPSPHGYPPQYGPPPGGHPPQYGPPLGGYPPPPAYPPAPYSGPPSPYGYPPVTHPYPSSQPYPPYGYPPQAPYPMHPGHGSYTPGMYVGHSSSGKHSKHYKHKMPKHSMYQYGHPQPHYPMHGHHYKHKKHKMFGKGHKVKKFKGFKKFKF